MSGEARGRAKALRAWAAALTPLQRRLFLVLANDVAPTLAWSGRHGEARDLQRRCDAIRKVDRLERGSRL